MPHDDDAKLPELVEDKTQGHATQSAPATLDKALNWLSQLLVVALAIATYHFYILKPWELNEAVVVDFRALSDAQLGTLAEKAAAGGPIDEKELASFIERLHSTVATLAGGRTVLVSGAVVNPSQDLTQEVAAALGIDLAKGLEHSLSGVANKVAGTVRPPTENN